ncbi:hypothetical protein GY45DRAFT_1372774 [Cubamyces sp. BRFM 1775]|nr:hypothetical protein GY45DRAFT_1372774 [Cubamyces sp. BRFM 1775]
MEIGGPAQVPEDSVQATAAGKEEAGHRVLLPEICIMDTLGGSRPEDIDPVTKHFLIPVFPDPGNSQDGPVLDSLGSSNEQDTLKKGDEKPLRQLQTCGPRPWPNAHQWLTAFQYTSPSPPILGPWSPFSERDGTDVKSIESSKSSVNNERLAEWAAKCNANPELARRSAMEYRAQEPRHGEQDLFRNNSKLLELRE